MIIVNEYGVYNFQDKDDPVTILVSKVESDIKEFIKTNGENLTPVDSRILESILVTNVTATLGEFRLKKSISKQLTYGGTK